MAAMLHQPNPTAPYTVRNLLGSNEYYTPSYKAAGQNDCISQMTSIHSLPDKSGGTTTTGPFSHDSPTPNYLYGETTRTMYMKSDVNQPNSITTTSQIHEGPPQGIYIPTSI